MSSESYVQSTIIKWLQSIGWYVIKVVVATKSGVPDIVACDPCGNFWAFECKVGSNKASPLQLHNISEIEKRNGRAFVVYSLDQVKHIVKQTEQQLEKSSPRHPYQDV